MQVDVLETGVVLKVREGEGKMLSEYHLELAVRLG